MAVKEEEDTAETMTMTGADLTTDGGRTMKGPRGEKGCVTCLEWCCEARFRHRGFYFPAARQKNREPMTMYCIRT